MKLKSDVEAFFLSALRVCCDTDETLKAGETGVFRWLDMVFDRYGKAGVTVGSDWLRSRKITQAAQDSIDQWEN